MEVEVSYDLVSDCLIQKYYPDDILFTKNILCDCGENLTNVFVYYDDYANKDGNQKREAFVKAYPPVAEGKKVRKERKSHYNSVADKNLWVCLNEKCSFRKSPGKPLEVCFF
jgi:hypothetical protein